MVLFCTFKINQEAMIRFDLSIHINNIDISVDINTVIVKNHFVCLTVPFGLILTGLPRTGS